MDWEVKVVTQSNYIQNVRVNNCMTREDAEASALGMTGGRNVITSTPKRYNDETLTSQYVEETVVENHYVPFSDDSYEDGSYESLDKMEEEMYSMMCQIAMENDEELPTIAEFYEWLERND
jgi:hypothetical protein